MSNGYDENGKYMRFQHKSMTAARIAGLVSLLVLAVLIAGAAAMAFVEGTGTCPNDFLQDLCLDEGRQLTARGWVYSGMSAAALIGAFAVWQTRPHESPAPQGGQHAAVGDSNAVSR
jgi:hypothetical protein